MPLLYTHLSSHRSSAVQSWFEGITGELVAVSGYRLAFKPSGEKLEAGEAHKKSTEVHNSLWSCQYMNKTTLYENKTSYLLTPRDQGFWLQRGSSTTVWSHRGILGLITGRTWSEDIQEVTVGFLQWWRNVGSWWEHKPVYSWARLQWNEWMQDRTWNRYSVMCPLLEMAIRAQLST